VIATEVEIFFAHPKKMSAKGDKVSKAYITRVAHKNGVKITKEAKDAYAKLPDKKAVDDMITHASQLTKSVGKKTISGDLAKWRCAITHPETRSKSLYFEVLFARSKDGQQQ
jgi:hypothetical protein